MKNQNNNKNNSFNHNKNNVNELNLIFSENIKKIEKVNKFSFIKKNFVDTVKTMENSFDNILNENYLFDDVVKNKKKIKININKNNNNNENVNNNKKTIENKKNFIFKNKFLSNINNNTFSNNKNKNNKIIVSQSTPNIRKIFYNKLLNFDKNKFLNKNFNIIKNNFSDCNVSINNNNNNKNIENKNNKSEINFNKNHFFTKSFYPFNKRKNILKNEETNNNSLFTKNKTNNKNEYNYKLSKNNLKTIYLKCETYIKNSQKFLNYMENKNSLENKSLSKILNKSSKPKYSKDVKVIQNKLKKNKSSMNIFTNINNNHKINVDFVYKMADNFAFEHRKELMKKLNYNYSNDKDFIFQKDCIKIRENLFKEIMKKKTLNFKFSYKFLDVEKMMDKDYKIKNNLMMRLDEDHQKYLKNGYFFKDKINNNINKNYKIKHTISLPKLNSFNLND